MLGAVGDAFGEVTAFVRPHVAVVGLPDALERDAELIEGMAMTRRAIPFAMHQPGEIELYVGHAGIERESLGKDLTLTADRLLVQRKVSNADDSHRTWHAFLLARDTDDHLLRL